MEIWKDIKGYEGLYKISDLGNFSKLNYRNSGKEKILKGCKDKDGYIISTFRDCNNIKKTVKIHQLVAIAFLNHKPDGTNKLVINHKNFIRDDNRLENLEIVTTRENNNRKHLPSTSKYTGVHWCKNLNKWISKIRINGKGYHLGCFINEYNAHLAYQKALLAIPQ